MSQTSISFGAMSNDPGSNVCQGGVDTVVFFINPKATVNAGADERICFKRHLQSMEVLVGGYFRYLVNHRYWYLCNSNASALNAVYTFSAADTMANQVDLILFTTNDPTGLCGPAKIPYT